MEDLVKAEVKEMPVYKITKVKLKAEQLTVDYTETYPQSNYANEVSKYCQQIVHPDLKVALDLLKPHVVGICELAEAKEVNIADPSDSDMEKLKSYVVTGYSRGGSEESAGVCIIAQKLLTTGQVLNLTVPFTKFSGGDGEGYKYGEELESLINRCDYEVDAYLFEEKWGVKQESLDFDTPVEADIPVVAETDTSGMEMDSKPKGRKSKTGTGRKKKGAVKAFDEFA